MSDGGGKKVLVVEDDAFNRELLVMELSDAGYEVRAAEDGEAALRVLQEFYPDLILLDIMMPKIDGLTLLRLLRSQAEYSGIPVILLTAKAEMGDKIEGLRRGANDYITKPFDMREVLARIEVQFRLKELEGKAVEAERLKAVLEMAGAAAHELSQPISGAIGHVYLMLMGEETDDGRKIVSLEDLKGAESCLRRATEILHKIQSIRSYSTREYHEGVKIVDIEGATSEAQR